MQKEKLNSIISGTDNTLWISLIENQWKLFISSCNIIECKIYNGQLLVPMKDYLVIEYNLNIEDIRTKDDGSFVVIVKEVSKETIKYLEKILNSKLSFISVEHTTNYDNIGYEPIETYMIALEFKTSI